jgi:ureidoglycolate hydrolase
MAFASHKTSFVKNNGRLYNRYKQVWHVEQNYKNKNKNTNVFSIKFDSCYFLTKDVNGVHAMFVGTPVVGSKKKVI